MSLLSPEQVAERCALSRKAVYRAIERGELPASKLCSRLRIRAEDVDEWIRTNEVAPRLPGRAMAWRAPATNGLRRLLHENTERA